LVFPVNTDLHEQIRQLIVSLKNDGLEEYAKAVNDAMLSAATGTELMMAVRFAIESREKLDATVSDRTKRQMIAIAGRINDALSG